MTVRLTVYTASWRAQVAQVASGLPGLIPVVKGNGYGFGRSVLMSYATELAGTVAVGTVHELGDVPASVTPLVLTPSLTPPGRSDAVVTVGSPEHVESLDGWAGRVVVKLRSSMRRYGCGPDELPTLHEAIDAAGLHTAGYALHLPLTGTDDDRCREIADWLPQLPPDASVSVSHLGAESYAALRTAHPTFRWRIRTGTALWIDTKDFLHLTADVIDSRRVRAGDVVGYRDAPVLHDGTLLMVGAGMANGVAPLPDGRSPFHFAQRRLQLVELPHMHTSLVLVPSGDPTPHAGERVDLQRPLTATTVDEIEWR